MRLAKDSALARPPRGRGSISVSQSCEIYRGSASLCSLSTGIRVRGRLLYEIFATYYQHIKGTQPRGPCAIAGYSFGAMIAFEVSKLLEANGDEVKSLGSFNLPPHIQERMRQLDWVETGINLSYFLDFISEEDAYDIYPALHKLFHDEVLHHLMSGASPERLEELSLTKTKL